jgi:hypothetical protein
MRYLSTQEQTFAYYLVIFIGHAIGLEVESGELFKLGGVTGENRVAYFHKITIKVGNTSYQTKVGFMNDMREGSFGMVGQKGFFNHFAIKFDYSEREFVLHKKNWV